MIVDFDLSYWLWVESLGTYLPLNQDLGTEDTRRFQLNPGRCSSRLPVRVTDDDVPQGDGKIPHRRWRSGYGITLAIEPLQSYDAASGEGEPACDTVLQEMIDLLGLYVNATIRTGLVSGLPNARVIWRLAGETDASLDRMLDRVQLESVAASQEGSLGGTQIVLEFDTPFPYYMDETETQETISGTGTQTITNTGNSDTFPVLEIHGPTSYVEIINNSVVDENNDPLRLIYDAALPGAVAIGGSDYVEVTFFDGKAYLNGSGANRKAGIDFRYSDFFPLIPGDNEIEVLGATVLIKANNSYA